MSAVKRRGPRRPDAALDQAMKGMVLTHRWMTQTATFLTALEARVLMGEASLPPDLCKTLHDLLRQP